MNALWSYFWPAFAAGLLVGGLAGTIAFRRRSRRIAAFAVGVVLSVLLAALWHGPLGGAARFETRVQRGINNTFVYYDMEGVSGHLHHGPLTRRVMLSGKADDFQQSELVRYMTDLPGVSSASWSNDGGGVPLIVECAAIAVLGYLFGLVLAYLVELRRRYNAQWNW